MSTAVISPAQPEQILKGLGKLWTSLGEEEKQQGKPTVLRACAMTLIVVTDESDEGFAASQTISELMREHPSVTQAGLEKAREFNAQRYYFQGIGRYAPEQAYARGIADLSVLARLVPEGGFVHGPAPTSIDAGIYGFIANIYFLGIETPLKEFVRGHTNLVRHCRSVHAAVS